jgi:3-oxoacyl-[acyl-carrier-protein] synthase-3
MPSEYSRFAAITGWGKSLPPTRLTNSDLSTILTTSDNWIVKRTGIRQRPISHVAVSELAHVAAARALACAGLAHEDVEIVILGSCTGDDQMPNTASRVQRSLGARRAAAMDVNTACTSFMYAFSVGSSLIRTGAVGNAVVIGADTLSRYMDWTNRGPAVLFGDGAGAIVLQAVPEPLGIVGEVLGCDTTDRDMLRINGMSSLPSEMESPPGTTSWVFDGREIFRQAVTGMVAASKSVIDKCGIAIDDIDLVIPHQANLRIIESVSRRLNVSRDRVYSNVEWCGNLSSASIPVALVDALDEGRISARNLLLIPAFGGGLTWSAHVVRWGTRTTALGTSTLELPRTDSTGLDLVGELRARRGRVLTDGPG